MRREKSGRGEERKGEAIEGRVNWRERNRQEVCSRNVQSF